MIRMLARRLANTWSARAALTATLTFGEPVATANPLKHPLHTTLAVVTVARDGRVDVSLRAFVDDYTAAARAHSGKAASPTADVMVAYARSGFALIHDGGRAVALKACGVRFEADLVWICFKAAMRPADKLLARNTLLFETFGDQVNIVQIVRDGRRSSVLFTKGDQNKRLAP